MVYQLPPMPYPYDALEPTIDAQTMEIHHTKHHAGYVNGLNKLLEGQARLADLSLEKILADISIVPEDLRQGVRNNGGGHLNHSLFWHIMGPPRRTLHGESAVEGKGGRPGGILAHAIDTTFGDFEKFKQEVLRVSMARFGSGWCWLVLEPGGKMEVVSTPNQDSPIMLGYRPVLGVDLWEHAYYLKYQNRRAEYINAWWNVVDWDHVADVYSHCLDMVAKARK